MTDPVEHMRRASELTAEAERLEDKEVRERLLRMADHCASTADRERWLAARRNIAGIFSAPAGK